MCCNSSANGSETNLGISHDGGDTRNDYVMTGSHLQEHAQARASKAACMNTLHSRLGHGVC
eukprot:2305633-Alexandrium_andersonii.AAC.1